MSNRPDLGSLNSLATLSVHPPSNSAATSYVAETYAPERDLRRGVPMAVPRLHGIVRGLVAPLSHRIRRGEGGLLVVNATLALKFGTPVAAVAALAVSVLTLLALYLFNDIVDAEVDQHNPKKDHALAAGYVRDRALFLALYFGLTAVCVVGAIAVGGSAPYWVLAVSVVNAVYSLFCKKVPLIDFVWVGLWGGAFVLIVSPMNAWVGMAAAMTAICHIYQISEDRGADAATGIATSATLRGWLLTAVQAGLCALLAFAAWPLGGHLAALSLAVLLAYWLIWREQPNTAWFLSKVHFSLVWAYLIVQY
jgi:4-hydroxybenzoate polyprenyltransferase